MSEKLTRAWLKALRRLTRQIGLYPTGHPLTMEALLALRGATDDLVLEGGQVVVSAMENAFYWNRTILPHVSLEYHSFIRELDERAPVRGSNPYVVEKQNTDTLVLIALGDLRTALDRVQLPRVIVRQRARYAANLIDQLVGHDLDYLRRQNGETAIRVSHLDEHRRARLELALDCHMQRIPFGIGFRIGQHLPDILRRSLDHQRRTDGPMREQRERDQRRQDSCDCD